MKAAHVNLTPNWTIVKDDSFSINNRVYITNSVTPACIVANSGGRKVTVTGINFNRILVITDNGVKTNRSEEYLDKLIEEE